MQIYMSQPNVEFYFENILKTTTLIKLSHTFHFTLHNDILSLHYYADIHTKNMNNKKVDICRSITYSDKLFFCFHIVSLYKLDTKKVIHKLISMPCHFFCDTTHWREKNIRPSGYFYIKKRLEVEEPKIFSRLLVTEVHSFIIQPEEKFEHLY